MAAESPFQISEEEVKNFGLAILVMTAALTAFFRDFQITNILIFGLISILALGIREIGHRTTAYFMTAYSDLEFSRTGAMLSIITAAAAVILDMPLIFLVLVSSHFRNTPYESWGYEIDVIWSKREYWFAAVGVTSMIIVAFVAYFLDYTQVSLAVSLFTLFQLLPFRENSIVDGSLDGAYILLQSGFMWLLFTGASLVGIALSL